jgi:hypothetical protein
MAPKGPEQKNLFPGFQPGQKRWAKTGEHLAYDTPDTPELLDRLEKKAKEFTQSDQPEGIQEIGKMTLRALARRRAQLHQEPPPEEEG